MNKHLLALVAALCASPVLAQEVAADTVVAVAQEAPVATPAWARDDWRYASMHLPPLTERGTIAHYPAYSPFYTGFSDWYLHSGMNVSLSAAAIVGLGRHSGTGFANTVSLAYADTLTSRLSFAVGGYFSRMDWRGNGFGDAGLTAMLNYRMDEHWEATVFAQKSIMQPRLMMPYFLREDIGDKIGAELRYNFSPSLSVGISVWEERPRY